MIGHCFRRLVTDIYHGNRCSGAGKRVGITDQQIQEIGNYSESSAFTPLEKLVLRYTEELTRTAKLSDAVFKRLRGFFDDRALMELVINTSIANMNNRITDSFIADLEP